MRPPEPLLEGQELLDGSIVERVIFVPTKKVGYLIGHSGRTISGFEKHTGVKINILSPNSKNPETPVALLGSTASIQHVIRMITDLYGGNNLSSQLWKDNRRDDDGNVRKEILATEQVMVKPEIVRWLISSHIEELQRIEEQSGAKIVIHQDQDDENLTPVDITGTAEQNLDAFDLLKEIVESSSSSLSYKVTESEMKYSNTHHSTSSQSAQLRRKLWTVEECSKKKRKSSESDNDLLFDLPFDYNHYKSKLLRKSLPGQTESSQIRICKDSVFGEADEINRINLGVVCKKHQIRAEIIVPSGSTNNSVKEIALSGLEAGVLNAKLDIIREFELNTELNNNK